MFTRRNFLKNAGLCVAALAMPLSIAFGANNTAKPNVVLLFADDLGYADLSCTGSELYQTPNIDNFASQSVRFTNAYTSHSTCAPSRLGIMTGQYPARLGVINNNVVSSVRNEVTLAEALKQNGYTTCHIGKWHLGNDDLRPLNHGFDYSIASNLAGQPATYFYPFAKATPDNADVPDLEDGQPGDHLTPNMTDKAVEFIASHKDEPFFLYHSYYAVHTPIQAQQDKIDKYTPLIEPGMRQNNATYAGLIEHHDDSVGRILEELENQGIADNTIVIYFSDNGGADIATSNYPLRSFKGTEYDGGIRVPMFIRWPGVTQAAGICEEPVIGHDLYPTILSMTGTACDPVYNQKIDGKDMTGLLNDPSSSLQREALHWLCYPLRVHFDPNGKRLPQGAIRKGDWKLVENFSTPQGIRHNYELYNLKDDPSEKYNLINCNPAKAKELIKEMIAWRKDVSAPVYDEQMYEGL